jgi:hypothetical protein
MYNQNATRIFYDSEFTGLHQYTTLISLALLCESGLGFYAEFNDFAQDQCDDWIKTNVLQHTQYIGKHQEAFIQSDGQLTQCFGNREWICQHLQVWLAQFHSIEIWADCLAYDWVLFCQLFGGALHLPGNIFFMPFDLVDLLKIKNIDPNVSRSEFAGLPNLSPHHALSDANLLKACFQALQNHHEGE